MVQLLGPVQEHAEDHAQEGAENSQPHRQGPPEAIPNSGTASSRKRSGGFPMAPEIPAPIEGGEDAGHQGRIVEHADAHHLQGKKSPPPWASQTGRQSRALMPHITRHLPVLLIQPQPFSQLLPQGSPQLQGRPLPFRRRRTQSGSAGC